MIELAPYLSLLVLGAAVGLMALEVLRPDLVALLVLLTLAVTGLVTPQEALAGFSHPAVVALAGFFVLSAALARTGAAEWVGQKLLVVAGTQERRVVATVAGTGGFLSLFMNTIGAAAILIPAVVVVARKAGINFSKLFIPLSFGVLLGGMATLLSTGNLLASEILRSRGFPPFSLLDFIPVGGPAAAAGIVFLVLFAPRLLPERASEERLPPSLRLRRELTSLYRLSERVFEVRILPDSPLAGQTIAAGKLGESLGCIVLAIVRNGHTVLAPSKSTLLAAGDLLLVVGRRDELEKLAAPQKLEIEVEVAVSDHYLESEDIGMVEATLSPRSSLAGKTLREINFRERYGLNVLAFWRGGEPRRTHLADIPLQLGDALLLQGPWEKIRLLQRDPDFLVLEETAAPPRREKAPWVVAITMGTLGLVLVGILPFPLAAVLGAVLVVLSRSLLPEEAYQAIDWRTLVLIAGLLPLGTALERSGGAQILATIFLAPFDFLGSLGVLVGLFFLALLLAQGLGNAATVLVLSPLALSLAAEQGASSHSFLMAVALASLCGFLTPLSHPANLLIMGLGNYRFRDYARVGFPLTIVVSLVILALLPIFWPLR